METWDRFDILISLLATIAIFSLETSFVVVLGRCAGKLFDLIWAPAEAFAVKAVSALIGAVLSFGIVAITLFSMSLLWKVWTLP